MNTISLISVSDHGDTDIIATGKEVSFEDAVELAEERSNFETNMIVLRELSSSKDISFVYQKGNLIAYADNTWLLKHGIK